MLTRWIQGETTMKRKTAQFNKIEILFHSMNTDGARIIRKGIRPNKQKIKNLLQLTSQISSKEKKINIRSNTRNRKTSTEDFGKY